MNPIPSGMLQVSGNLDQAGYVILRNVWEDGELDDLRSELDELGKFIVGPEFSVDSYPPYAHLLSAEKQSLLYDRLKYLPALSRLSGSKRVIRLCKDLGMRFPSLMGGCNMRLDKPLDNRHLFEWHQDTLYLLGSTNALTLWIPLKDVNLETGTVQVIAGSHTKGIFPFRRITEKEKAPYIPFLQRDLRLDYEITDPPTTIVAQAGDIVAFRQMILHRSTPNYSDQIRWTVQLRLTDLGEPDHQRQRFPTGDKTNIFFVQYPSYNPAARNENI